MRSRALVVAGLVAMIGGWGECPETTADGCYETHASLIAGQTIPVGELVMSDDGQTLTVTYDTGSSGWQIEEVHLAVGCTTEDIPANPHGIPVPGQFPYAESFTEPTTSVTFEVPLSSLPCGGDCGGQIVLAAHAVVTDPGSGDTETAWAEPGAGGTESTTWTGGGTEVWTTTTTTGTTGTTTARTAPHSPSDVPATSASARAGETDADPWAFDGPRWGWFVPYTLTCCG